jgi:hypothetical protein
MDDNNDNIVAVHMIESSDGTYVTTQVLPEDAFENNDNEIITADDDGHHVNDETADNEELVDEEEEQEYDEQDVKNEMSGEEVEGNDQEMVGNEEADDIIIAEAVVVTQYSCKFCNRRFDTIDKVKNHYLLRHNKDQSIVKRFSGAGQRSTADDNNAEEQNNATEDSPQNTAIKKKMRPNHSTSKAKANQYNLRVVSNVAADEALLKKKRGRKPTGVTRKYPCDWPGCNYVARHSVCPNICFVFTLYLWTICATL